MNAHTLAPWWEVIKDILIPVAAILIPTLIAVKLARDERLAAAAARAEDRRLADAEAADRTKREGGLAAMEAMQDLLTAASTTDARRHSEIFVHGRTLASIITLHLAAEHNAVWSWMLSDLRAVGAGVADLALAEPGLSSPEVGPRNSAFQVAVMQWLQGSIGDDWFEDREPIWLEVQRPSPEAVTDSSTTGA
ncbi:hypothetical protein DZG00_04585 [Clavibacter lycopersici]|uniref:Uncharacterized protein n=1 Tax=Clavibacter lycopersici TaxID=2301718 RepID=A0A399TBY8_9MICO|nr:hypothetical protein [Clavibacter lycopersici]RIJ52514.1 hypothetical protein DZG00_04585 [Clavibacter lycopersici]RIJ62355.1 hypothetical protein DZG02_02185 [Clavibacter lycopersici]